MHFRVVIYLVNSINHFCRYVFFRLILLYLDHLVDRNGCGTCSRTVFTLAISSNRGRVHLPSLFLCIECAVSSQRLCIALQVYLHTNPLQSWQPVAARRPLSQAGPAARQAPWVVFIEYVDEAMSASATPFPPFLLKPLHLNPRTGRC